MGCATWSRSAASAAATLASAACIAGLAPGGKGEEAEQAVTNRLRLCRAIRNRIGISPEEVLHVAGSGGLAGGDAGIGGDAGLVDFTQALADAVHGVGDVAQPACQPAIQRRIIRPRLVALGLHAGQLGGGVVPALDGQDRARQQRDHHQRRQGA
jgi:hypothetical protein